MSSRNSPRQNPHTLANNSSPNALKCCHYCAVDQYGWCAIDDRPGVIFVLFHRWEMSQVLQRSMLGSIWEPMSDPWVYFIEHAYTINVHSGSASSHSTHYFFWHTLAFYFFVSWQCFPTKWCKNVLIVSQVQTSGLCINPTILPRAMLGKKGCPLVAVIRRGVPRVHKLAYFCSCFPECCFCRT